MCKLSMPLKPILLVSIKHIYLVNHPYEILCAFSICAVHQKKRNETTFTHEMWNSTLLCYHHTITSFFFYIFLSLVHSGIYMYLSVLGVTPVTSQDEWSWVVIQLPSPSISITAAPEQRSRVKRTSWKQHTNKDMMFIAFHANKCTPCCCKVLPCIMCITRAESPIPIFTLVCITLLVPPMFPANALTLNKEINKELNE